MLRFINSRTVRHIRLKFQKNDQFDIRHISRLLTVPKFLTSMRRVKSNTPVVNPLIIDSPHDYTKGRVLASHLHV